MFFISFEIYLMFEVVSEGRYSLMRIIDNPFFAFVVYVISSVLLGCILHFIVKYIKKYCLVCLNKVCALDCSITILCLQIPKTISE